LNIKKSSKKIIPLSFFSDGLQLSGFLHLPANNCPSVVIGSHGLFSTGNSPKQIALAQKCTEVGLAYFRFDHRGCGNSEGEFKEVTSLKGRISDLSDATQTMLEHPETGKKIALFGSSMGGTTALSLAADEEIEALVTIAAPLRSEPILKAAKATGDLRGLPISFYENQLNFDISDNLTKISRIMIFHGDTDEVVPVSDAHELYSKAFHPKKLFIHEDGDHPMSNINHQIQFMRSATEWFDRWLNVNKY
jgi:alpha-beta hydrolase superfamily lysophospholipase